MQEEQMSSFNATFAAFAALALVVGVVLYAVLAVAWRMLHEDGRLRLEQMLRRHGATPEKAFAGPGYQAAVAIRRCIACSDKARCDEWLAKDAKRGMEAFCPNADFVGRVAGSS
jgi:hypothetical protein